jgi:colicin import membrane protein
MCSGADKRKKAEKKAQREAERQAQLAAERQAELDAIARQRELAAAAQQQQMAALQTSQEEAARVAAQQQKQLAQASEQRLAEMRVEGQKQVQGIRNRGQAVSSSLQILGRQAQQQAPTAQVSSTQTGKKGARTTTAGLRMGSSRFKAGSGANVAT